MNITSRFDGVAPNAYGNSYQQAQLQKPAPISQSSSYGGYQSVNAPDATVALPTVQSVPFSSFQQIPVVNNPSGYGGYHAVVDTTTTPSTFTFTLTETTTKGRILIFIYSVNYNRFMLTENMSIVNRNCFIISLKQTKGRKTRLRKKTVYHVINEQNIYSFQV